MLVGVEGTRPMWDHSDSDDIVNDYRPGPMMLMRTFAARAASFEAIPFCFID